MSLGPQAIKKTLLNLQLLRSAKIEYLLIDGSAVGHYGFPQASGDLDIWVASSDENATEVDTISLADLKWNKRANGRHQDLNDLEKLP